MINAKRAGKDWRTILSLAVAVLGLVYFLVQALIAGVLWIIAAVNPNSGLSASVPLGLLVWSSLMSSIILVPVVILNIFELKGKRLPPWLDLGHPRVRKILWGVLILWPLLILIGWFVVGKPTLAAFLLGPVNVLVAGLPILWLINAAQSGLKAGSLKRKWQIFGFSLTVSPMVIIVVEFLIMLILMAVWVFVIAFRMANNPQIERDLMYIANQAVMAGDDLDTLLKLLKPYVLNPSVIFWSMAIIGGFMPVVEELLKPLALWSLANRKISPQEGFVAGLLCGAGFALFENVMYFATVILVEDWLLMAIARSGTGVLHMLASGLVGWGMAKAWRDGQWAFLAQTTFVAIVLHGIWNVLALVVGIAPLYIFGTDPNFWQMLLSYTPLIFLLMLTAGGMFGVNRYLKKKQKDGSSLGRTISEAGHEDEASDVKPSQDVIL